MTTRLAVDIGGTFTDAVLEHDAQQTAIKVLTTPDRPAEGFMTAVHHVLDAAGVAPAAVDIVLHGTTLATNALIERKGAPTALIVTEGHRDSLEIAYENRFAQYDIMAERRPPLVPRRLRLPAVERMDASGQVVTALDEDSVRGLVLVLRDAGVESVAIGLLHAYANPAHEQRVAALLAESLPGIPLSLSSDVSPELREYDRQSTTVANAYIRPLMAGYLDDVASRLVEAGFPCPCLLMTSGGHLVTLETAARYPVRLIESGPAGGAILAGHIARRLGEPRILSFDMGGTTAKLCLIDDGEPQLSRMLEVDRAHRFMKGSGMPVRIPVIEMVEIGAGGGSIASLDALQRIHVGPESAGADPGPACYGQGGTQPTVTDADLALGRLDPQAFAGGRMSLDRAAAETALEHVIGRPLALDPTDAAAGVLEIVDETMAAAARVHAAEQGSELAGRTMIAFGGAAPLHAARLADKLGISRIVIPANAGVGSAIGFLCAPVAYEVVHSRYMRLDAFATDIVNTLFDAMRQEAESVVRLAAARSPLSEQRHAYVRYVGQGHEVKVAVPVRLLSAGDGDVIRQAFETEYKRQYGRAVPGLAVEVLTWSCLVTADRPVAAATLDEATEPRTDAVTDTHRRLCLPGAADWQDVPVHERAGLAPGTRIAGPAVLAEAQTTILVPAGIIARVCADGDIILERAMAGREKEAAPPGVTETLRRQLLWDRMIAIVEEQAQTIIRTAFSTTVREAGDLSAGLFDTQGRMLAQAITGTPGHVNAMAASVGFFLDAVPLAVMAEGDTYITNDPWLGTGHLFDFTAVSPVFLQGRAVGLFASTVHVVDIGGPGFSPDSGQVYEEGLTIPILPLFRRGQPNESVLDIIRANVREPLQVTGDLYSLAASNAVAGGRLVDLMDEFALDNLDAIAEHIVTTSRDAMRREIRRLTPGVYAHDMMSDGYDTPVRLAARMTVDTGDDASIAIDFTGSSPVSPFGINVPLTYTQAYASFGVRCIIGSAVPNNAGSLEPVRVSAPAGAILNALRPAAVTARHVIGQMLPDVVLGCLGQAAPGSVPAEGASALWIPSLSGGHGMIGGHDSGASGAAPFTVTVFLSGGSGGRPGRPGLSATAFPSGVRNTPVEVTESVAPLLFRRKELRPGSGGAGRWPGGDGQVIEIAHRDGAPFAVFALFDRVLHPARGRDGGADGAPGVVRLASGGALRAKGKQIVPAGDSLVLELPGGAGLGKAEG